MALITIPIECDKLEETYYLLNDYKEYLEGETGFYTFAQEEDELSESELEQQKNLEDKIKHIDELMLHFKEQISTRKIF